MVDRVVLHIGTMKSGSTYLQHVLDTGILESVGGFCAGGSCKVQIRAVDSLSTWTRLRRPRAWRDLAQRVQRRDGVAVYSHELLSFVPRPVVRNVVASFDGAPVDVLLTVRDQRTAMPAQWQSYVRNRGTDTWDDYVRRLEAMRGGVPKQSQRYGIRNYRRSQDVPGIIARWGGQPGVSSVGVVLVPAAGSPPQLLWQRFCEGARIGAPALPAGDSRENESLGYASCELLRRLNPSLKTLSRAEYERARRPALQALLPLRAEEGRPVLDRQGGELARELNRRIVEAVSGDGVRLVGSPDELPVAGDDGEPSSIPPPDPEQVRRAFETVWARCIPGVAAPADGLDDAVAELGRRLTARFGP